MITWAHGKNIAPPIKRGAEIGGGKIKMKAPLYCDNQACGCFIGEVPRHEYAQCPHCKRWSRPLKDDREQALRASRGAAEYEAVSRVRADG